MLLRRKGERVKRVRSQEQKKGDALVRRTARDLHLAVRLWASKEMALLLLLLVLALGPAKRCVVPSRLFMAPKAMMAMRTSSSSASIPRRLE